MQDTKLKIFKLQTLIFQNAHKKQEKTQNKKMQRSNKENYQEQFEDQERTQCMYFSKILRKLKYAIDTNFKI